MKKSYLSRKESIVLSAIDIIDELGVGELSIRELAKRQNVTEPALYRHFNSKQDILLATLDYFSHFDNMIAKTIEERKLGAKEGIEFFIRSYCEYYENYPAMTAILSAYDTLRYDAVLAEKQNDILEFRSAIISRLIEKGQAAGEVSKQFQAEDITDIIIGSVRHIIFKWRTCKYGFPLKQRAMLSIGTLLKTCL